MANTQAAATMWNCPNYVGELFLIGANQTPFLNMIGGLQGGRPKIVTAFEFPLAQPWALESASQPSISETAALTAPTAWTYVRGQDRNTVQIFQRKVSISYAKLSATGHMAATSVDGLNVGFAGNPIQNEKDFQINAHLRQIAKNAEYSFINGVYQEATSAAVAAKTRGIIPGISTNSVAASGATLSKSLMDELLRTQAANGSEFMMPVVFCNAFQKQKISDIYAFAPTDRNVGGVNIKTVETDFATFGVVYTPNVATSHLLVADMQVIRPAFLPVPDKGLLFYEPLSKSGAGEDGQLYGQMGIDYGPEEYHGKITGLATS